MTRRAALLALPLALALASGQAARAHGEIPTSNAIGFGAGDGQVMLGTNFGAVLDAAGGAPRFLCERLVTGEQTAIDVWLWLGSGGVAGAVTQGGFIRGVYVSDEDACGFVVVPGTEPMLMADLVADPIDARGFFAVGETTGDAAEARLVRREGEGVEVLARRAGAIVKGVRAAGGHAYAVFIEATESHLVHVAPDGQEAFVHPRVDDELLRPLGVDPTAPTTLWLVGSTTQADVLYRSVDGGQTLTPVLTIAARLGGFAIDGATVWLQSPQKGVHRATDGGIMFTPIAGSPHGSCLALGADRRLFACGVPWQDGMALGVSEDGASFAPVLTYFDGIVGPLDCDDAATTLCGEELTFLRAYYGFSDPSVVEGAETVEASDGGPEPVEAGPEPAVDAATEADGGDGRSDDDGCRAGTGSLAVSWLGLALVLLALRSRARAAP